MNWMFNQYWGYWWPGALAPAGGIRAGALHVFRVGMKPLSQGPSQTDLISCWQPQYQHTEAEKKNGRHFADYISKYISWNLLYFDPNFSEVYTWVSNW